MLRRTYPSDLSDAEWAVLESLVPGPQTRQPPFNYDHRGAVNAVLYVLRTGGHRRAPPHDLPPWDSAWRWFRVWRLGVTWEAINAALRERGRARRRRELTLSGALLDSQGAKTLGKGDLGSTTPPRRRTGASATSWSTLRASRRRRGSGRPISRTPQGPNHCWQRSAGASRGLNWSGSTATQSGALPNESRRNWDGRSRPCSTRTPGRGSGWRRGGSRRWPCRRAPGFWLLPHGGRWSGSAPGSAATVG